MLFCDVSLASRIERAEARLLAGGAEGVAKRLGKGSVFSRAVAGGYAAFTEPGSPLNKVAGLGFDGPVPEDELETWLDVTVHAFLVQDSQGVPSNESFERDVLRRIVGDFVKAEGMTRYLARREGAPAGGGSMKVEGGIAQLCGAATLPEHRRRGVQTALLSVRLADAAAAGCDLAVVTTQPGSKSQENVQKRGFSLLYSRAVLVRAS